MKSNEKRNKIPKRYANAKLEDFKIKVPTDTNLFICGNVGCGKTHLAMALRNDSSFDEKNESEFVTSLGLLIELQSTMNANSKETFKEAVDYYSSIKNLYLDDLGSEKVTEWSTSALLHIISQRDANLLYTVITSNKTLEELADVLGDRMVSRISGMCEAIKLDAKDKRQQQKPVRRN